MNFKPIIQSQTNTDQQSSYRQIMKATSLFGGVQIFQIIIQIIKSKIVAVILGTVGMGISGLLISTTGLISTITNFGLGTSGIKSIAEADGSGQNQRVAVIVSVLKKSIWITGLLGMLVTIAFSSWVSEITFGNKKYTVAFIWLSVTLLFDQLSTGQLVVLQGLRKYKHLANANLTGAILGLVVSVPLYYSLGINGIVPAIIGTSLLNLLRSWYFVRKVKIEKVHTDKVTTLTEGKIMVKMGFVIGLSGVITIVASYITKIFISNYGNIQQVGLYNAAFTLLNSYVGLVFTAMSKDYFPRLSAHAEDNDYCQKTINQQAEISFLLLTPILVVFLLFCPIIIRILYTPDFLSIEKLLYWAILGMLFRAASWSISFIFIAKGKAKIFFFNELVATVYTLSLNIAGYYWGGLTGVGIAFVAGYVFYFVHMSLLGFILFKIKLNKQAEKLLFVQTAFTIATFLIVFFYVDIYRFIWGIPIVLACFLFSYLQLDKRLNVATYFLRIFKQYK